MARRCAGRNEASSCQISPSTAQEPPAKRCNPAMARNTVVLPLADGPNSPVTPDAGTANSASSVKLPSWPLNATAIDPEQLIDGSFADARHALVNQNHRQDNDKRECGHAA